MGETQMNFDLALQLYEKGAYRQCIDEFNKGLDLNKRQKMLLLEGSCDCHLSLHEFKRAIEKMNMIIELDSSCAEAFLKRSRIHHYISNNDMAKRDIKKALELDPHNIEAIAFDKWLKEKRTPAKEWFLRRSYMNAIKSSFKKQWFEKARAWFGWRKSPKISEVWDNLSTYKWLLSNLAASLMCFIIAQYVLYKSPNNPKKKGEPYTEYPRGYVLVIGNIIYIWIVICMWNFQASRVGNRAVLTLLRVFTRGLLPSITAVAGTLSNVVWERSLGFSLHMLAVVFLIAGLRVEEDMGALDMACCLCISYLAQFVYERPFLFIFVFLLCAPVAVKYVLPKSQEYVYQCYSRSSQIIVAKFQRARNRILNRAHQV